MTDIYQQHRAAFASVSAYVVMHRGERVATVAFKYPRDGASRLYAYVHWLGSPMVRGFAAGGGYDKHTAACASAARKVPHAGSNTQMDAFFSALSQNDGYRWNEHLRIAGFDVLQAV